jgi:hypothetical protein
MAPVLKTGIPERVSGVRIPSSPPASLHCRETAPPFPSKYAKDALAILPPQTGLQKTDCSAETTIATRLFYGGHTCSPVLGCLGKRGGNFLVHLPEGTTRRSSGWVWRKVPDDILSYLGVGLNLSARRSSATAGSLYRSVLFR